MSNKVWFLSLLAGTLLLSSLNSDCIDCLETHIHKINSIDFSCDNLEDLDLIGKNIQNDSIVLLGEHFHDEGTTLEAKARLVKYLHEKLGFNTLLIEDNIFTISNLNDSIGSTPSDSLLINLLKRNLTPTYSRRKGTFNLFRYISNEKKGKTPIDVFGFDPDFSPELGTSIIFNKLKEIIKEIDSSYLSSDRFRACQSILEKAINYDWKPGHRNLSNKESTQLINLGRDIDSMFKSVHLHNDSTFYLKWFYAKNTINYAFLTSKYFLFTNHNPYEYFNYRDSLMAGNIIWLKEKLYPKKKIIIWAATYHTSRNLPHSGNLKKAESMGDILYKKYDDKMYNIAFVGCSGTYGLYDNSNEIKYPKFSKASIENLFITTNYAYGFLDLKRLNMSSDSCKLSSFKMFAVERESYYHQWRKSIDGIFFIRQMYPNGLLPVKILYPELNKWK